MCDLVLTTPSLRRALAVASFAAAAALADDASALPDFRKLFGTEIESLPPIIGIAVGADADNTHGHSLAHVADLLLEP